MKLIIILQVMQLIIYWIDVIADKYRHPGKQRSFFYCEHHGVQPCLLVLS